MHTAYNGIIQDMQWMSFLTQSSIHLEQDLTMNGE